MRRHPFAAVNLISDPIHGYIELTKRLGPEGGAVGLPDEATAEEDLLDTAWLQRLRRVSQLQSARWVFPTAEHSRFTHGLGTMHEAGLWARHLYPTLRTALAEADPGIAAPSEGLVVETLRIAGLLHDVGHGPFAHFFDDHILAGFTAPADTRRPADKALSHEDLSQLIVERELGELIGGLRRAPGILPERDAFAAGERIDPRWVSFLISKPALADPAMPRWVRWLQPLLSGVFTVDNLDYVRRDAYLTGVAIGPVDVERLRRYCFIGESGLTIYEPGLGALEMFLTARLFMYRSVYFHRTVRAIDLDLADVFGPSIRAIFGERSPVEALSAYADLDEYALLHQAALWARDEAVSRSPRPGDGTVTASVAEGWRRILLRQPRWRSDAEVRADFEPGSFPDALVAELGPSEPGRTAIDLAVVDARPAEATATDSLLAVEGLDGRAAAPLSRSLARLPAFSLIARRYRRTSA
jgi:HD superfamily phosphohydrolase